MALLAPLEFSAEDEQRLRKLFDRLDHDHKGYIVPQNIKELLHELGHELPADKVEELLRKCDPGKIGKIEWEPFVKGLAAILPKLIAAVVLIGAFKVLDTENTGFIARADLEKLVRDNGVTMEQARLDELIMKTNPGPDGRIQFKIFVTSLVAYLRSV